MAMSPYVAGLRRRIGSELEAIRDPGALLVWKSPDRAIVIFRDAEQVRREGASFVRVVKQWIAHVGR